jgi:hypothetical protein
MASPDLRWRPIRKSQINFSSKAVSFSVGTRVRILPIFFLILPSESVAHLFQFRLKHDTMPGVLSGVPFQSALPDSPTSAAGEVKESNSAVDCVSWPPRRSCGSRTSLMPNSLNLRFLSRRFWTMPCTRLRVPTQFAIAMLEHPIFEKGKDCIQRRLIIEGRPPR